MADLHPIALCNMVYQILAKTLKNRLCLVLPHLISENQSAFIIGRSIIDNILIAFEINHFLARKRQQKMSFTALKIDISKAYDRVNWIFLQKAMMKMGFHE